MKLDRISGFLRENKRELVIVAVILVISVLLAIPGLINDLAKQTKLEEGLQEDFAAKSPESQGMDGKLLGKIEGSLAKTDAVSFLIVKNGFLVYEKYFNGSNMYQYNNVYSVTKSFTSALFGTAMKEGYIKSLDQLAVEFFPEYSPVIVDPKMKEVTLKQLLTMTPGFVENFDEWTRAGDMMAYPFVNKFRHNPGEAFEYANSASHLLSGIVTKATGQTLDEFGYERLFKPLGIKNKKWDTDAKGYNIGASNLFLRPRDMAKFGYLYMKGGKWKGKQLIDPTWIKESTSIQYSFSKPEDSTHSGYGYQWWISDEYGTPAYFAKGYGGQNICVFPEYDLIVVNTANPAAMGFSDDVMKKILNEYIFPSMKVNTKGGS